jgi:hypothetical protein
MLWLVHGVDPDGRKELFDDFVGRLVAREGNMLKISNGVSIYTVPEEQCEEL